MTPHLLMMVVTFLLAITGVAFHRFHFISILLCIESMMLSMYSLITLLALHSSTPTTSTIPLILLTLSACEAGTGLALLVATIRTHSSDYMNTLNILQC